MTAAPRTAAAFLRQAGLVAAVLAVMAGIFGMHVLTGTHLMHSPALATGAASIHHSGASGDQALTHADALELSDPGAAGHDELQAMAGHCSGSGACSDMQAMTGSCIPSAKTASLAAPPPGILVLGISNSTVTACDAVRWTFLPGSPSPGELSISRT
ncbi:hypothetical protein [Arthrobacter sp. NPDC056493]|uniref:hypothetical protein n=1 Tax=Arthrobacter sp. NPDC056493 TaxID=3345839 RepID=UPI00366C761F